MDTQLTEKEHNAECENMILNIYMYALYDNTAKRFDTPFFCQSDLMAKRHYALLTSNHGSVLTMFQQEFDLYRMAEFDYIHGTYTENLENILSGKNYNNQQEK